MAGKLINTLKYGDSRTKRKIYLLLGILASGVILATAAFAVGNIMFGLLAFVVIFGDGLILFNTSFQTKTLKEQTEKEEKRKRKKKEKSDREKETKDGKESQKLKETREREVLEQEENPLLQYDEGALKKLMVSYKVKKHHILVMIDNSQTEKISQCPAIVWKDSRYLYFLLLEQEARMVKSPIGDSCEIHIRRGIMAKPKEEYAYMREPSLVSSMFGDLLPKYYTVENSYRIEYKKNLYSAAPSVWCSAASVKNLVKLLPENFVLDDGTLDGENDYYKEIYIARVMCWDEVYSGQEYKEKVLEVLKNLARADISETTLKQYLQQMMQKGLIPKEYAEYAMTKRK